MEYSKGGLIGKVTLLVRQVSRLNIPLHAANTGFFLILSFFPALVLLLGILRYTPLEVSSLVGMIQGFIPQALLPEAEYLILTTYQATNRTVLSLSALMALWSAGRGIWGLEKGLNAVYGVTESRGWLYTRCISAAYTLVFLLVLILTLVLHVFGTELVQALSESSLPFLRFLTGIVDLRFFLLIFLQTLLFAGLYRTLPNGKRRFSQGIPGALLSGIGWTVFSHGFSVYVEHFSGYANIYGSVYAIALSMLWLYFCILIVLYGGLLNRILEEPQ